MTKSSTICAPDPIRGRSSRRIVRAPLVPVPPATESGSDAPRLNRTPSAPASEGQPADLPRTRARNAPPTRQGILPFADALEERARARRDSPDADQVGTPVADPASRLGSLPGRPEKNTATPAARPLSIENSRRSKLAIGSKTPEATERAAAHPSSSGTRASRRSRRKSAPDYRAPDYPKPRVYRLDGTPLPETVPQHTHERDSLESHRDLSLQADLPQTLQPQALLPLVALGALLLFLFYC